MSGFVGASKNVPQKVALGLYGELNNICSTAEKNFKNRYDLLIALSDKIRARYENAYEKDLKQDIHKENEQLFEDVLLLFNFAVKKNKTLIKIATAVFCAENCALAELVEKRYKKQVKKDETFCLLKDFVLFINFARENIITMPIKILDLINAGYFPVVRVTEQKNDEKNNLFQADPINSDLLLDAVAMKPFIVEGEEQSFNTSLYVRLCLLAAPNKINYERIPYSVRNDLYTVCKSMIMEKNNVYPNSEIPNFDKFVAHFQQCEPMICNVYKIFYFYLQKNKTNIATIFKYVKDETLKYFCRYLFFTNNSTHEKTMFIDSEVHTEKTWIRVYNFLYNMETNENTEKKNQFMCDLSSLNPEKIDTFLPHILKLLSVCAPDLERMSLKGCKLSKIPDDVFTFKKLKHLDVSHNQIENIPKALEKLEDLEVFDAKNNSIETAAISLLAMKKLKKIDLSNNSKIVSVPYGMNDSAFYEFINSLSAQDATIIKNIYAGLTDEIHKYIARYLFYTYSNKHLIDDKSNGVLEKIAAMVTKKVKSIDLSGMIIHDEHCFVVLRLLYLIEPHIEYISLASNNVVAIPSIIGDFKKLKILDVSNNKLTELPKTLENLDELVILKANNNDFKDFDFLCLQGACPLLDIFVMDHNDGVDELPCDMNNWLFYNSMKKLVSVDQPMFIRIFKNTKDLTRKCICRYIFYVYTKEKGSADYLDGLKMSQIFDRISDMVKNGEKNGWHLDLSNVSSESIGTNLSSVFDLLYILAPKLESLSLCNNKLKDEFDLDACIAPKMFANLKRVDLSNNLLKNFPKKFFLNIGPQLSSFKIDHNDMQKIDFKTSFNDLSLPVVKIIENTKTVTKEYGDKEPARKGGYDVLSNLKELTIGGNAENCELCEDIDVKFFYKLVQDLFFSDVTMFKNIFKHIKDETKKFICRYIFYVHTKTFIDDVKMPKTWDKIDDFIKNSEKYEQSIDLSDLSSECIGSCFSGIITILSLFVPNLERFIFRNNQLKNSDIKDECTPAGCTLFLKLKELDISGNLLTKVPDLFIHRVGDITSLNILHNQFKKIYLSDKTYENLDKFTIEHRLFFDTMKKLCIERLPVFRSVFEKLKNKTQRYICRYIFYIETKKFLDNVQMPQTWDALHAMDLASRPERLVIDLSGLSTENITTHFSEILDLLYLLEPNLEGLSLYGNTLKGIPNKIGNFLNLTYLDISHNDVDSLPEDIVKCVKIREIYAAKNAFKSIPAILKNLPFLEIFDVHDNEINKTPNAFDNFKPYASETKELYEFKVVDLEKVDLEKKEKKPAMLTLQIPQKQSESITSTAVSARELSPGIKSSSVSTMSPKIKTADCNSTHFTVEKIVDDAFLANIYSLDFDTKYRVFDVKWTLQGADKRPVGCIIEQGEENNSINSNEINFDAKIIDYNEKNKLERFHEASVSVFKMFFNTATIIDGQTITKEDKIWCQIERYNDLKNKKICIIPGYLITNKKIFEKFVKGNRDFDTFISRQKKKLLEKGFHWGNFILLYEKESMDMKHAFFHEFEETKKFYNKNY